MANPIIDELNILGKALGQSAKTKGASFLLNGIMSPQTAKALARNDKSSLLFDKDEFKVINRLFKLIFNEPIKDISLKEGNTLIVGEHKVNDFKLKTRQFISTLIDEFNIGTLTSDVNLLLILGKEHSLTAGNNKLPPILQLLEHKYKLILYVALYEGSFPGIKTLRNASNIEKFKHIGLNEYCLFVRHSQLANKAFLTLNQICKADNLDQISSKDVINENVTKHDFIQFGKSIRERLDKLEKFDFLEKLFKNIKIDETVLHNALKEIIPKTIKTKYMSKGANDAILNITKINNANNEILSFKFTSSKSSIENHIILNIIFSETPIIKTWEVKQVTNTGTTILKGEKLFNDSNNRIFKLRETYRNSKDISTTSAKNEFRFGFADMIKSFEINGDDKIKQIYFTMLSLIT